MKEIIPEVVAGAISILVILADFSIVAFELVNGKPAIVPDVFSNLTFAIIAVYFTQQAAQRATRAAGHSFDQGATHNGATTDANKPPPPQ